MNSVILNNGVKMPILGLGYELIPFLIIELISLLETHVQKPLKRLSKQDIVLLILQVLTEITRKWVLQSRSALMRVL